MNISVRLFLGYFLMVGLAAWFVLNIFSHETEPGVRQATEETLVDTAHILAELVAPELAAGTLSQGHFAAAMRAAEEREPGANIWGVRKDSVDFRIYVTDAKGIVVYDSDETAVGADYSQWRDVARVLRGEYGARSTRENPDDPYTSVMYVAAPVLHRDKLIGVLSVAKPMASVVPYIERAERRVKRAGYLLLAASAAIGLIFSLWLTWSINRLRNYARAVANGERAEPPTTGGHQFSELARALARMREKLDGKQYVEKTVQNLAHEMKSPLSAVVASAELLENPLPDTDRQRFAANIGDQGRRMQQIIDRMLQLARLDQLQSPENQQPIALADLARQGLETRAVAMEQRQLHGHLQADLPGNVPGDAFLLQQAIGNLLDNAIAFSPPGGRIEIRIQPAPEGIRLTVRDHGAGAPDYALGQVFDRFYSLPRPATGQKSTGLGLAFVREIARLHGGTADFANHPTGGAEAGITLPAV